AADLRALREKAWREDEARRIAHVVREGLDGEAEEHHSLPAERTEVLDELPDHAALLELVHLDDGREQLEVVARVAGELLERGHILGEAGAGVADSRAQEERADAPVKPHALRDDRDVRTSLLADVGDLVDERDLRG